jgi:hypothetical protein
VLPALKSPNFVAGVSGWSINRDGSAEFNNVTVRGEVDIGPALFDIKIVTGTGIPSELTTAYNVGPATVTAAILWYWGGAANTYHYYCIVDNGGGVPPGTIRRGNVLSGTLIEFDFYSGADYSITSIDNITVAGATPAAVWISVKQSGDTNNRYDVDSAGFTEWGPGNAATDTVLYRGGVDTLATDDLFRIIRSASTSGAISTAVSGDTNARLFATADGKLAWGPGNAGSDTSLYRSASATLAVNASLVAEVSGSAETWHAFPYSNSWTDSGGTNAHLQYRKTALNEVQIIGVAHSPNPFNAVIGTLPSGYRPSNSQGIWAWTNTGSGQLVRVDSSGVLTTFGDTRTLTDWWINGTISLQL